MARPRRAGATARRVTEVRWKVKTCGATSASRSELVDQLEAAEQAGDGGADAEERGRRRGRGGRRPCGRWTRGSRPGRWPGRRCGVAVASGAGAAGGAWVAVIDAWTSSATPPTSGSGCRPVGRRFLSARTLHTPSRGPGNRGGGTARGPADRPATPLGPAGRPSRGAGQQLVEGHGPEQQGDVGDGPVEQAHGLGRVGVAGQVDGEGQVEPRRGPRRRPGRACPCRRPARTPGWWPRAPRCSRRSGGSRPACWTPPGAWARRPRRSRRGSGRPGTRSGAGSTGR